MFCRDVMTKDVKSIHKKGTIREAARIMRDEDIGFLVVVDSDWRIVGVVTDRDLAIQALPDGRAPEAPVGEIMTTDLVSVGPDDDLTRAEQALATAQVSRVPVVDTSGRCVGVIGLQDLVVRAHEDSDRMGEVIEEIKEERPHP